jgi:hypothetical protein
VALASVLTLPAARKVFIPFSPDFLFVVLNQLSDFLELFAEKSMRLCENNWLQPKLGISLSGLHMDMDRFLRLPTEKEKSITMMSENLRH